jgi:hypothetical protein
MRAVLLAQLRVLAAGITEREPVAAADRLMELIAVRDDAEDLRAALVAHGALALAHPLGSMVD